MFGPGLCLVFRADVRFDVWYYIIYILLLYYILYIYSSIFYSSSFPMLSSHLLRSFIPLLLIYSSPNSPPSPFSSIPFLLSSLPYLPLLFFIPSSSFQSISIPSSHSSSPFPFLLFQSSPSLSSKVYVSVLTYAYLYSIPSSSKSDPACFIGGECRVVQF